MKKYESPEIKVNAYSLNKSIAADIDLGSEIWWDDEFDTPEEGNE